MKSVEVKIVPGGKASRKEVLVRILYAIVIGIIGYVLGIVAWVLIVINFFSCLLIGTRIGQGFFVKIHCMDYNGSVIPFLCNR